ncbi:glycerol dehydratase reactivase beta/small subunit family protein [Escherichia coli]|uniref:glycerol dehydratase reactivase beta/small subunit family protein n=1 Tax=Escherichia coli TaxID=562 RepID=UPI003986C7CA
MRHPLSHSTYPVAREEVKSSIAPGRLLVSPPCVVGIACDREKLIVHYKNLPASAPLFTLMYQQDNHTRRSIGNNAARLVKGIPFRVNNFISLGGRTIVNATGS